MAGNESTDMSWLDPPERPPEDPSRDQPEDDGGSGPGRVSTRAAVIVAAVTAIAGAGIGMEVASGSDALGVEAPATARAGCDLLRQVPEDFMEHAPDGTASAADATGSETVFWQGRARLWAAQGLFEIASQLDEPRYEGLRVQSWRNPQVETNPVPAGLEACAEAGL